MGVLLEVPSLPRTRERQDRLGFDAIVCPVRMVSVVVGGKSCTARRCVRLRKSRSEGMGDDAVDLRRSLSLSLSTCLKSLIPFLILLI